ncbi:MAG: transcriptional repressor [Verrucomicrobia bacterium]|nr:transcriptional repressor [Verrucomicrobiota bacterium]
MNLEEKQQRLAQFAQAHRENGLPVTMQRRAVFESVLEREDHPSADEVYAAVRAELPEISRMTVYRILGNLVALGLLNKICHPGSVARFDPKIYQHHHLVCLDCGGIIDLEEERLNKVAWPDVRRFGFEIADYHIHFRGRCAACRQAAKKSRKPPTKRKQTS